MTPLCTPVRHIDVEHAGGCGAPRDGDRWRTTTTATRRVVGNGMAGLRKSSGGRCWSLNPLKNTACLLTTHYTNETQMRHMSNLYICRSFVMSV